jgi:hypothetical protein
MSLPGVESSVKYYFPAGAAIPKLDIAISYKMPVLGCQGLLACALVSVTISTTSTNTGQREYTSCKWKILPYGCCHSSIQNYLVSSCLGNCHFTSMANRWFCCNSILLVDMIISDSSLNKIYMMSMIKGYQRWYMNSLTKLKGTNNWNSIWSIESYGKLAATSS